MLALLIDNDFTEVIIDGVLRKLPAAQFVRAREVNLSNAEDADVLEWAADHNRVVLSHDASTMTDAAFHRMNSGLPMRGLIIARQSLAFRLVIDDLATIVYCTTADDWNNRVEFLPLVR